MSSSQLEWPLASADGLPLSYSDCLLLLDDDFDIVNFDGDLLRNLPHAKADAAVATFVGTEVFADSLLYPPSPPECKPSRAQLASDLLQQLDHQCKQENFPNWFEERAELPMFEPAPAHYAPAAPYVPAPAPLAPAPLAIAPAPLVPAVQAQVKLDDTAELLREFETVFSGVELTHLTPPQSPPGPASQLLASYAQNAHAPAPWPLHEITLAEEVMRQNCPAPASPTSSLASSGGSTSTDEEWERPARTKPYSRSTDDRRSRKKEQNKNAATRYRQKKKAEIEVLLGEESALRQRQGELGTKCADLQREIAYIKGLMRDLFKAKGLIK